MEHAASASPLCSSTLGRCRKDKKNMGPLLRHTAFAKRVPSGIAEYNSKGSWWRKLRWETFLMIPSLCFAATCKPPTPLSKLRRQRGRMRGRRWSWCVRLLAERRPPPAPCKGCSGSEWRLHSPAGYGGTWEGGAGWPSIRAPLPASPAELQKLVVGGRAVRDLPGLQLLACPERWRWRIGSSVGHLLPTPQTVMVPRGRPIAGGRGLTPCMCVNRLLGVSLCPVSNLGCV